MASSPAPAIKVTRRLDYAPPAYRIAKVDLSFDIKPRLTVVTATSAVTRRAAAGAPALRLHKGKHVSLQSVTVDGAAAKWAPVEGEAALIDIEVTAAQAEAGFTLVTVSHTVPEDNTELEGLYQSGGIYCTQCEAEGFRNITPFIDRPDNLAVYTVRVEADKALAPVLLSNGNEVDKGELPGGRHFAVFHDPWPKPCYLFALVAGPLVARSGSFTTRSGKPVGVHVWTRADEAHKTAFALESVYKAMKWDEDSFGLEYDLNAFHIVSVADFNMGAMENKGLNVFNSRLVLATPATATDTDFGRIEGVIGHEYFHNYTGNRVTCRDWFQLTLKEGLTVYRDQEFSADLNSRPVKRIEDVSVLRRAQFTEDSGPMAHPIRPDEVAKMDNFYSATVYEKGAEVIRIYATLLGKAGFRKGMDLYFQRHDGDAVTCDDFFAAMADANAHHPAHADLPVLKRWYSQAGTPRLTVSGVYDAAAQTYTLTATQHTPATPGQPAEGKQPVLIPIAVGLVTAGGDLPLTLAPGTPGVVKGTTAVLRLSQAQQSFTFTGVTAAPVPSVLRGFSAPVVLSVSGQGEAELTFLLAHDSDAFNRFEAGQRLGRNAMLALYGAAAAAGGAVAAAAAGSDFAALEKAVGAALDGAGGLPPALVAAFQRVLEDASLDGTFVARAVTLPSDSELIEAACEAGVTGVDPVLMAAVRGYAVKALARGLEAALRAAVARVEADPAFAGAPYSPDFASAAKRALRNKAFAYLTALGGEADLAAAAARAASATNMTDEIAALACLMDLPPAHATRAAAVDGFYAKWQGEPLVLLKWLALQAMGAEGTAVTAALLKHAAYRASNPNCSYNLLGSYAGNAPAFHAADGSGYALLADAVLMLDAINPQVAARIVAPFGRFSKYDAPRRALMLAQLRRMADSGALSANTGEIVSRALATA